MLRATSATVTTHAIICTSLILLTLHRSARQHHGGTFVAAPSSADFFISDAPQQTSTAAAAFAGPDALPINKKAGPGAAITAPASDSSVAVLVGTQFLRPDPGPPAWQHRRFSHPGNIFSTGSMASGSYQSAAGANVGAPAPAAKPLPPVIEEEGTPAPAAPMQWHIPPPHHQNMRVRRVAELQAPPRLGLPRPPFAPSGGSLRAHPNTVGQASSDISSIRRALSPLAEYVHRVYRR